MTTELKTFLDDVETTDYQSVAAAATEYVKDIPDTEIQREIRAASDRACLAGDGNAVWRLKGIVNKAVNYGPVIKRTLVNVLMNDPRLLRHFSPEFAKGVVSRFERHEHARGAAA